MVFARTKLMMQDNCFEKDPGDVELRYVGPHVSRLYDFLHYAIKTVFNIPASSIQEEKYNWGKGETEKISVSLLTHKDMDMFSYIYLKATLKADGNERTGNAVITIKPYMRTEYPQDTVWQRSLFYEMLRTIWHRVFYAKKREEYTEECRHLTYTMQEKLREYFRELREMSH
jgi:hypothetical protein